MHPRVQQLSLRGEAAKAHRSLQVAAQLWSSCSAALHAKQTAEDEETGTTQDTLGRFPMVTAAMEIFFCWLDLNNIWLLGCSTLPARLGWILRPASSTSRLQAGPRASKTQAAPGFPLGSPGARGLVSRRRGGGKKSGGGKEGRKKRHLFTNCSQL